MKMRLTFDSQTHSVELEAALENEEAEEEEGGEGGWGGAGPSHPEAVAAIGAVKVSVAQQDPQMKSIETLLGLYYGQL